MHSTKINDIFSKLIFWSRWLQAPLYLGLILVLVVYVYEFGVGLWRLLNVANGFHGSEMMLQALDLIDVVMLANLLIMVIIGGYETFVANIPLDDDNKRPEWLDELNAGTLKVKLALALIGISSIHLLRTFIDPSINGEVTVKWQVIIHITLILSAIAIAFTNKILSITADNH